MLSDVEEYIDIFWRFRTNIPTHRLQEALVQQSKILLDNPAALLAIADFCIRLDFVDEARRFFTATISADNSGDYAATARLGLAALLEREAGQLRRRVLRHCHRRVAENPDDPAVLIALARALAAVGRGDGAESWFRRAGELEPGGEAAALGLARLYGDWRQWDAAGDVLTAALAGKPRSAPLLEALVGVRDRQGRPADVADACLTLLRINPYNPPVARRLSAAVAAQGWFEGVMRDLAPPDITTVEAGFRRRFDALPPAPAGRLGRPRVFLVCYAQGAVYEASQVEMGRVALERGASHFLPWRREDVVATDFYRANRGILDLRRGAGYWLWKPYIILQALLAADDGDWVWFHDTGHVLDADITPVLDWAAVFNDGYLPGIYQIGMPNRQWTKRDCFVVMDCDHPAYWDHCSVQATWNFWRKSPRSLEIVSRWLTHAVDPRAITDHPNVCGRPDLPDFIDHRADQSVLSLLVAKMGLTTFGGPNDPPPPHPKDIRYLVERVTAFLDAHGRR